MSIDQAQASSDQQHDWASRDIDLLLSGGGFRATLFHLGVIRFLLERNLLGQVRRVFSVSGGSILAGLLALNWNQFKTKESFERAAQQVIAYCQSDVRGRILRRYFAYVLGWCAAMATLISILLFRDVTSVAGFWSVLVTAILVVAMALGFRHFWLITMFQRDLARTLRNPTRSRERSKPALLKDLPEAGDGAPDFHILATDLTIGRPWTFTRRGVAFGDTELVQETYPLSGAVAASAAFPALFSPVRFPRSINPEKLGQDRFLADGGIFDNLGIAVANADQNPASPHDLIVCDAERCFEGRTEGTYTLLVSRTSRVTDIMMNRISSFSWEAERLTSIRLGDDAEDADLAFPVASQRLVRQIRTDLDAFSAVECQLLVAEGYLTASRVLAANPRPKPSELFRLSNDGMPLEPREGSYWLPFSEDQLETTVVEDGLRHSHRTPIGLFAKRDPGGHCLLVASIFCLFLLNPLTMYWLGVAWTHLPAFPAVPMGSWYGTEEKPLPSPADLIRSHLWSAIKPAAGVEVSRGVFVSEPLSSSYGWWPQGNFQLEVSLKEPFRLDVVTAYLVDPKGRLMHLSPSVTDRRRFVVDIPSGSSQERLCMAVLAIPDQGSSPQDFKLKSVVDIRVFSPGKETK